MLVRVLIGIGVGACIGALMGYFGKCSSGACPLTATPWRGAVYGGVLGVFFAMALGAPGCKGRSEAAAAPGAGEKADSTAVVHVKSREDFTRHVLEATKPCLADFYSNRCPPCRMLAPIIGELAEAYEGRAIVCKVSLDAAPALAAPYKIRAIPAVLFFEQGKVVHRLVGLRGRDEYEKQLDRMLAD